MTNDEGMTKINSRTSSESNEGFLQRVPHIFGFVIRTSFYIRHSCFVVIGVKRFFNSENLSGSE
jgi:hypothetical protein